MVHGIVSLDDPILSIDSSKAVKAKEGKDEKSQQESLKGALALHISSFYLAYDCPWESLPIKPKTPNRSKMRYL